MATVRECLETKITDSCDVLVCGGGIAGIAATITNDFTKLDLKEYQTRLQAGGVVLHEKELAGV